MISHLQPVLPFPPLEPTFVLLPLPPLDDEELAPLILLILARLVSKPGRRPLRPLRSGTNLHRLLL